MFEDLLEYVEEVVWGIFSPALPDDPDSSLSTNLFVNGGSQFGRSCAFGVVDKHVQITDVHNNFVLS